MIRYDTFQVNVNGITPDADGFLLIKNARPTRAGIFSYKDGSGKVVRELRSEEEVFRQDSMDTLAMKPFSIEHMGLLRTAKTAPMFSQGSTGDAIGRDGDYLTCSLGVHGEKAVDRIVMDGILDLSAGYKCDTKNTPGVHPKYGPYDRIQTNIRYNHLTSTRKGRGEGCQIRLDSETAILTTETETKTMKVIEKLLPAVNVGEFRLDAEKVQIPEEESAKFDSVITSLELVADELKSKHEEKEGLEAKLDSATKDLTKAKADLEGSIPAAELQDRVAERADLLNIAGIMKLDKADEMDNEGIKRAVVVATGKFQEDKLGSAPYLDAAFDQIRNDSEHVSKVEASKQNLNHWQTAKEGGVDLKADADALN